ncbi:hypothetical protein [Streptomyces sp. NPDC096323]|uniref:hypothetical protein n=1 Tax=Streptomyces sp. NPDC096323 TaxID=3155822 RepID=UPI003318C298
MISNVFRHPFPTEKAEADLAVLQESGDGWIDSLEADSAGLGEAFDTSLLLAKGRCLLDPQGSFLPTWAAWVNSMQIASAMFASTTTAEDHVQCRIAHKDRTLQATEAPPSSSPRRLVLVRRSREGRNPHRLTGSAEAPTGPGVRRQPVLR